MFQTGNFWEPRTYLECLPLVSWSFPPPAPQTQGWTSEPFFGWMTRSPWKIPIFISIAYFCGCPSSGGFSPPPKSATIHSPPTLCKYMIFLFRLKINVVLQKKYIIFNHMSISWLLTVVLFQTVQCMCCQRYNHDTNGIVDIFICKFSPVCLWYSASNFDCETQGALEKFIFPNGPIGHSFLTQQL